jgi:hypothetical protein
METDAYTLVAVVFIIFLSIITVFIFIVYKDIRNESVFFACPRSECPTSLTTGEKRCPVDVNESVLYDPVEEVCNSRYTCENSRTPYALMSDGSTNNLGVCEKDSICRCLTTAKCSSDIITMFSMSGNVNQPNSRSIFYQKSLDYQGNGGSQDFSFTTTNTDFCSIKAYHLNRISPGACTFSDTNNISLEELTTCFRSNPCQMGLLAFYPENPDHFPLAYNDYTAIYSIPVACVPGKSKYADGSLENYCSITEVPIWNRRDATVECRAL